MKNNKGLEYFWNRASKARKCSTSSSPSNDSPIPQGVDDPHITPSLVVDQNEDGALLSRDPGKRKPISSYPVNDQDDVRREYIAKGPCRPRPIGKRKFPQTLIGKKNRRFGVHWYDEFDWLEYSVQNDAAFCFYCFLFKGDRKCQSSEAFVNGGWSNWSKLERLWLHVGNIVVLSKAPKNHQVTSPKIQKDLIKCCAKETTRLIIEDLCDSFFGILADESSDVSHKEELAICLRYVNKKGEVCERFLGVVHIGDTASRTLLEAIKCLLDDHLLLISNIRGQGYDGASNMRGEINGLKKLIIKDSPSAYYIHCFAHQLQLTLVAVAKENCDCASFFLQLGFVLNVIGVSCKRLEMVRVLQAQKVLEALELGEIESGRGLNQELGLSRPGDTRWGSHFKSIVNLIALYSTIIDVLVKVEQDAKSGDDRVKAQNAIDHLESFDFIFMLHLMQLIFGYTNDLCEALQRRDQDIVNAMTLVSLTKERSVFCVKHKIEVPNMNDFYAPRGRSRRYFAKVTNIHRFRVEMFLSVIDLQVQELNNRFDETNMELLLCMACLNPVNSFASFNKQKLLRLAKFYPSEFSCVDIVKLDHQLDLFVDDMRKDSRFQNLKNLGELSILLVETNKHVSFALVFLLLKLVLILPVATASVERVFSSMTFVKNKLRNSMSDKLLNNCLVTFVERDLFVQVSDDDVLKRFQNMKSRRMVLDFP
ncbi:hypothetical protein RND81_11G124600 [Saponaria officinalis]|uniref:TTF-type domain-containing protein n=1 Tax=Saponaria officinalis TaxID=3572 RepID=A0AAW1HMW4_SAPOF